MGAACSTRGLAKYKKLKGYVQSKACLTFKAIQGFLPHEEYGDGPPIVLIGENHIWSESEENRKTCATALLAMSKIVSTCADDKHPESKVLFFVEDELSAREHIGDAHPFFKRFNVKRPSYLRSMSMRMDTYSPYDKAAPSYGSVRHKGKWETWAPIDETQHRERFALDQVREDIKTYRAMYKTGFLPVHTDIFHGIRITVSKWRQNLVGEQTMISGRDAIDFAKIRLLRAYTFAGTICGRHEGIQDDIRNFDALSKQIDDKLRSVYYEYNDAYRSVNSSMNNYNEKIKSPAQQSVEPWMYHVSSWVAHFLIALVDRRSASSVLRDDTYYIRQDLQNAITTHTKEAHPENFFSTLTLCGDVVTYLLFLQPRFSRHYENEVCVFYGGDVHMQNFSKWIKYTAYAKDFEKMATLDYEDRTIG